MNAGYSWDLEATLQKVGTGILLGASIFLTGCPPPNSKPNPPKQTPAIAVTTYHYDNLRSGWNSQESQLNYSNVSNSSLSPLVITLDDANDLVDTQPLIVPNLQIAGAQHDVVYVTTENDSIYAFDANTGARLNMVNLGPPVPKPQGCFTNGPTEGITGTPVIDLPNSTMYVITYNLDASKNPVYFIHALDLLTLKDNIKPQPVNATQTLTDGTSFTFNAAWQRQRPGLLLANGNVYAGFGSICDWGGQQARGWVMGWRTPSLTPLLASMLTNNQISAPTGTFLSGVWMSGYGIAGDQQGNIYFSTGNSDISGTTNNWLSNPSDSVVRLNSDLSRPSPPAKLLFTPGNVASLDAQDLDFSAGGVMLLPSQSGSFPNLLVATAKDGRMFLLNRDNLGGHTDNDAGALYEVNIGNCWCGPSYFNDGIVQHIVASGGTTLGLWDLQTSPTPKLTKSASATLPDIVQNAGFFTTVSSKGNSNAIIWGVSRPQDSHNPTVSLYAFNATPSGNTLTQLFQSVAGSWPYLQANANIVPVVANGKVYVASNKELDIFALTVPGAQAAHRLEATARIVTAQGPQFVTGPEEHQICGTVRKVDGNHLTIQTRDNKTVEVDTSKAQYLLRYPPAIAVGGSVVAAGSYDDTSGILQAVLVWRIKPSPTTWPPDR